MKIVMVGSGGRECALAKKLAESAQVTALAVAPGSDAIEELRLRGGKVVQTLPFQAADVKAIAEWARHAHYDLVVPGPESCLEDGLGDWCLTFGIPFCGPSRRGARLETSKAYQHEFNEKYGIPAPDGRVCETLQAALSAAVDRYAGRCAVKADGPALGKGVIIAHSADEAREAVRSLMLEWKCGRAGERLVIQELLEGEELSLHVIADKRGAFLLETARDYKRAKDNDEGDNTGGMGGYSPSARLSRGDLNEIESTIIERWRFGCEAEEFTYRGILYPGLMMTFAEGPMVLEFNIRFGDPEAQVLMRRFAGDLAELLYASATDTLREDMLKWSEVFSVCVVMASRGYPERPETGKEIFGLDDAAKVPGVEIFHSGTKKLGNGKWYTAGGRVLSVTAAGATLAEARTAAYEAANIIKFEGAHFRRDIGGTPLA